MNSTLKCHVEVVAPRAWRRMVYLTIWMHHAKHMLYRVKWRKWGDKTKFQSSGLRHWFTYISPYYTARARSSVFVSSVGAPRLYSDYSAEFKVIFKVILTRNYIKHGTCKIQNFTSHFVLLALMWYLSPVFTAILVKFWWNSLSF